MPRKKKEEFYNDCWMYILLLTTLVILMESLKTYTFKISGVNLTYSLFLLPISYFLVNYIVKKYDYKKAVSAISLSAVAFVLFSVIMSFALGQRIVIYSISGEFFAYVVSQFINLTIYEFLMNNTTSPFIIVFLTYLFDLIVYYMIYALIYLNLILLDTFWIGYFTTLGIQIFICIALTILDKKIIRGRKRIK